MTPDEMREQGIEVSGIGFEIWHAAAEICERLDKVAQLQMSTIPPHELIGPRLRAQISADAPDEFKAKASEPYAIGYWKAAQDIVAFLRSGEGPDGKPSKQAQSAADMVCAWARCEGMDVE